MRASLIFVLLISSCFLYGSRVMADELPKHRYQQEIQFAPVPMGDIFKLDGKISLPLEQGGKLSSPSGIAVYEKVAHGWTKTAEFPFSGYDAKNNQLLFHGELKLSQSNQPFALHFTAVHCHQTGRGLCVIDHFQGLWDEMRKQRPRTLILELADMTKAQAVRISALTAELSIVQSAVAPLKPLPEEIKSFWGYQKNFVLPEPSPGYGRTFLTNTHEHLMVIGLHAGLSGCRADSHSSCLAGIRNVSVRSVEQAKVRAKQHPSSFMMTVKDALNNPFHRLPGQMYLTQVQGKI